MVIIITGASHTGKTLLAQKLLEKFKYPYLSIDHLKMGLIRSGNTKLTPMDDDKLTIYLWPIIRETIKTAIENNQNLIIEGCYIPSNWKDDFSSEYINSIKLICLAMSDSFIKNNFEEIMNHSSDIEHRIIDSNYSIDDIIFDNNKYINEFSPEDITLIDSDYSKTIDKLIKELV